MQAFINSECERICIHSLHSLCSFPLNARMQWPKGPRSPTAFREGPEKAQNSCRILWSWDQKAHTSFYTCPELHHYVQKNKISSFINFLYQKLRLPLPLHLHKDPIFIPGHGFELRVGGLLGVWIFTQGCANPSHSEAAKWGSLARLVLVFMTQGWLIEPLAVLMLQDHLDSLFVLSLLQERGWRGSETWAVWNSHLWVKRNKSGKHLQGVKGKSNVKAP